jgi:prepilin-type N-terminal cleavage/methylation domain-containing protein
MMTRRSTIPGMAPGFTLLEVMIAIAVLAMIMVMLAGSFHAVATGKRHAEDRIALQDNARGALGQMVGEIRGAVQTPMIQSRVLLTGEARMQNGQPLDTITVSTLDPGHRRALEDWGAEDTIAYTTAPNPGHPGWFMLLRSQSSSLLGIGTGGSSLQPAIVANNLLSLHIRYFDGNQWGESWNSQSLPPGRQLPTEIAIEMVTAANTGAPSLLSTRLTLPMAFLEW